MFGYGFAWPAPLTSEQTRTAVNATLTEPAQPRVQIVAEAPPTSITHVDRGQLLTAALRARKVIPGPVGELVAREMTEWAEFGFRLGGENRIGKLVTAVMAIEYDPEPPDAA